MSTPIKPFSCGTCNEAYTDSGAHQPLVFECGHGSCKGCVLQAQALSSAKTVICQECKYQVLSVQTPNYALIEQMQNFSSKVVE